MDKAIDAAERELHEAKRRALFAEIQRIYAEDLPVLIELVDQEKKVRAVLPELDAMVTGGLITLQPVEVIAYRAESRATS